MNLLKAVFRSFYRFKLYTFINLIGLILGLTCSIVLFLYVSFETSYDEFHSDKDRIFRVSELSTSPKNKEMHPNVRIPVGPDLKGQFAEIEDFIRLRISGQNMSLKSNENSISIKKSLYADANFFRFFSFDLKSGKPGTVLQDNNSMVLTEKVAELLFGNQDPVGATVLCNNHPFVVSGIARNVPLNSHIYFDVVFPLKPLITGPDVFISWNGGMSLSTFLKLHPEGQKDELEAKLPDFLWEKINKNSYEGGFFTEFFLEPLNKIHLYSKVNYDNFSKKDYKEIMRLFFVGLLVLIIAIFNYIFISNAILSIRSKEFEVKKCLGIGKYGIIKQAYMETLFLFFTAGLIAVFILLSLSPEITQLFGVDFISLQLKRGIPYLIFFIFGISAITILIQYFGFYRNVSRIKLSGIKPLPFRNKRIAYISSFQFCVSIVLISFMLIIYKQLNFALHKDLGFKSENIINVSHESIGIKSEPLINEIGKLSGVINVSSSYGIPGLETTINGYLPEGTNQFEMLNAMYVDDNFFNTFHIEIIKGRNFRKGKHVDNKSFIINETLAKQLGWDNPVGKRLFRAGFNYEIIGVAKDFHVASVYYKIPPLLISKEMQDDFYTMSISVRPENIPATLRHIKRIWNRIMPNINFNYSFLDSMIGGMYGRVRQTIIIILIFTCISIFISVLGLYGITSLLLNSRIKELGIRKVNGARASEILTMLNKDFLKWVVFAFIIACPIAYYAMNKWLQSFAYKTELSWWVFAAAGAIAMAIALLTVSFQSYKSATRNPVESLRYE